MSKNDLEVLKTKTFCKSNTDCYIILDSGFVTDSMGNSVRKTEETHKFSPEDFNRRRPENFQADNVKPSIDSFTIDMNSGRININFTEPVDADSLFPTTLSIIAGNNSSNIYSFQ